MNSAEVKMGENCCLHFEGTQGLVIKESEMTQDSDTAKYGSLNYNFDRVFGQHSTQLQVFDEIGKPLVYSVLEGFNSTLFVYGQTSSGKTHTMQGPDINDEEMKGVIPRVVHQLYSNIENSLVTFEWLVKVSIFEIYLEKLRDLLDPEKKDLKIREDIAKGVYVQGISEYFVSSVDEVFSLLNVANKNRIVASTKMNESSSRSHLLFQIDVYQKDTLTGSVDL